MRRVYHERGFRKEIARIEGIIIVLLNRRRRIRFFWELFLGEMDWTKLEVLWDLFCLIYGIGFVDSGHGFCFQCVCRRCLV